MQLYAYHLNGGFKDEVAIPNEAPQEMITQAQDVSALGAGLLVVIGEHLDAEDKHATTRVGHIFAFNGAILFQNVLES